MNKATEIAQRILEERGSVVMAWPSELGSPPKVGHVIKDDVLGSEMFGYVAGPFMVIGGATIDEFVEQGVEYAGRDPFQLAKFAKDGYQFLKVVAE